MAQFQKGHKGGPGRPKGSQAKTTIAAKEAIQRVFEGMGGWPRLQAWVEADPANERIFWGTIYPKLLPLQVTGDGGGPLQVQAVEFITRSADSSANR